MRHNPAMGDSPDRTTGRHWSWRLFVLTSLTMTAFAANPILCRLALKETAIDPASFTLLRILSGAAALWLIVRVRTGGNPGPVRWRSAFSLFAYAAAFSFAYVTLDAGIGTLLLFGAVQATMVLYGLAGGERLAPRQAAGFLLALGGLVALLLPGVTAPPLTGAILMIGSGIAWGVYSLQGRASTRPIETTAGNFLGASAFALALSAAALPLFAWDPRGAVFAALSGAVASGLGYSIWYTVLPQMRATQAATIQLSVPVLAALASVPLLDERLTLRLVLCSVAILGGIALALRRKAATCS